MCVQKEQSAFCRHVSTSFSWDAKDGFFSPLFPTDSKVIKKNSFFFTYFLSGNSGQAVTQLIWHISELIYKAMQSTFGGEEAQIYSVFLSLFTLRIHSHRL